MSDDTLAGSANTGSPDEVEKEVREVQPILLEKSFGLGFEKDFRPTPTEGDAAPKVLSAQDSVIKPTSAMGLEDVSEEDLENPAKKDAKKVTNQVVTRENGKPISSKVT